MTNKPKIRIAFNSHGLGDVVHCCHAMKLYMDRGYDVAIQIEANKRWAWEAAGIPIHHGDPLPGHPYYYPPDFEDLSKPDHAASKIAHLFEVAELPPLGAKAEVWEAICETEIDAAHAVSSRAMDDATKFLEGLPHPIFLLHSKGTNWQERKSIPDGVAFQLIRNLLETGGSVITLDWDGRAPTLGHDRVRGIKPNWHHISLEEFGALCILADLLIGIDSGPFHLAGWFNIPTLYVSHTLPPVRCCLPSPRATYLVPARDHHHWAARGPEWQFVGYPGQEATADEIAVAATAILAGGLDQITVTAADLEPFDTKGDVVINFDATQIPGAYRYRRVDYDERSMELLPDGKIGEGAAGCERAWKVEQSPSGPVLTIYGEHGGPTCCLSLWSDGAFRGRWLSHEKMPIVLTPDAHPVSQPVETMTWNDLVPLADNLPANAMPGHPSDSLPDAPVDFCVSIATLNCFDLLDLCIEAILRSTWLPKRIYVIDNSGGRYHGHSSRRVHVFTPTHNLGAGGTANFILPAIHPAPAILINDDIEVASNTLEAMLKCPGPVVAADGTSAFTCILIREEAWKQVGIFDPVFWPAYCEDADWQHRAELLGIKIVCPRSGGFKENGPSATRRRMTKEEQRQLDLHYDKCKAYYLRKWGGTPRLEVFSTPFNGATPE